MLRCDMTIYIKNHKGGLDFTLRAHSYDKRLWIIHTDCINVTWSHFKL